MSDDSTSREGDHDLEKDLEQLQDDVEARILFDQEGAGPYRIMKHLGDGGMGMVYLAEQEAPIQRMVALKVIKVGMDTREVVARFEAERQALALMDHPNIARVFSAGTEENGLPFFVMEFVDGKPVTQFCDQGCLGVDARLALFMAVCRGVQHAHQKGVLHRDLKPSNILVASVDGRPVPTIIDFGIAKALEGNLTDRTLLTQVDQIVGTPGYMSPEQARAEGTTLDTRTDIYSLGVLLHELLTGELPFQDTSLLGMQKRIQEEEPRKPSQRLKASGRAAVEIARACGTDLRSLCRRLAGDLDWITLKALEKEPSRRYASVSELEADVRRHLHHEPVTALRPTAVYRLKKFFRKNRKTAVAALAVLVTLVAGLVTSSLLYVSAESARQEVLRLSDVWVLEDLRKEAEFHLWPLVPERKPAMERWLARARALRERLPGHERVLAALRERVRRQAGTHPPEVLSMRRVKFEQHRRKYQEMFQLTMQDMEAVKESKGINSEEYEALKKRKGAIEDCLNNTQTNLDTEKTALSGLGADLWRLELLERLVKELELFRDPDPSKNMLKDVEQRLQDIDRIQHMTLESPEARAQWRGCIQAIRSSPRYRGLELEPQHGLLPLSSDPHSGFWEFWHVATGCRPEAAPDPASRWRITGRTAMIFVLVPGGTFCMGAIPGDPDAAPDEKPAHGVELHPFFLSRYETTQGQWKRFLRRWHSDSRLRGRKSYFPIDCKEKDENDGILALPVEQVNWGEAQGLLDRYGLILPTEAQWEYAARAGTSWRWWTGKEPGTLAHKENLADEAYTRVRYKAGLPFDDRFGYTAPAGTFPPNPWGFHDMLGNVSEWCFDGYGSYRLRTARGSGERLVLKHGEYAVRGGSYRTRALRARATYREAEAVVSSSLGFRAAREIQDG